MGQSWYLAGPEQRPSSFKSIFPYVAQGVTILGGFTNYLSNLTTGIADNGKLTLCAWVKIPASSLTGTFFDLLSSWPSSQVTSGPIFSENICFSNAATSDLSTNSQTATKNYLLQSDSGIVLTDVWMFLFTATDMSGTTTRFLYANGVEVTTSTSFNGLPLLSSWGALCIPGDGGGGSLSQNAGVQNPFDIADLQCWIGTVIDPSVPANYAAFVSGGRPVDPAIPASMFGQQTILLSGNSTAFVKNKGSGPALTLTGTFTNASSNPP